MLRAREIALVSAECRAEYVFKTLPGAARLFPELRSDHPVRGVLLGKWFHVNFYEMSSWSRSMLVPLAIINHFKPTPGPQYAG